MSSLDTRRVMRNKIRMTNELKNTNSNAIMSTSDSSEEVEHGKGS